MKDWLVEHLNERERLMYRIAMTNAKDPKEVDDLFYFHFAKYVLEKTEKEIIKTLEIKK